MNRAHCLILLLGVTAAAVAMAPGVCLGDNVVFEETFDGPSLPSSLTYTTQSSAFTWQIDNQQLRLDNDGSVPTTGWPSAWARTQEGFADWLDHGGFLRFSVDTLAPNPGSGQVKPGLYFGDYHCLFHSGLSWGAFRLYRNGSQIVGNTDMGWGPAGGEMQHIQADVIPNGSALDIDITITGTGTDGLPHTFNYLYHDLNPAFGTGTTGVFYDGPENRDASDSLYDNLTVQHVPEPATFGALGLGALALLRRRRTSR